MKQKPEAVSASEIDYIQSNNAVLAAQHFGNSSNQPLILIMGATASMNWWDDDFCSLLAGSGLFVIRYDNRDVGQSTCGIPGEIDYDMSDLTDDLMAVADHYSLDHFHVMGMSLGGMIAQIAAIQYPDRIKTLILLCTSIWDDLPRLPAMSEDIICYNQKAGEIDWKDKDQAVQFITGSWKILSGSKVQFEENRVSENARLEVERSENILSRFNHGLLTGCEELYGHSALITAPTLIFHGDEDPIFPLEHGYELEKTIHNSKLTILEGTGHELPSGEWLNIAALVTKHISENK